MRRQPTKIISLITLLAAAAVAFPDVAAADDDPLAYDARSYAADYKVSQDEALRRLQRQHDVGMLNATLAERESGTFAGLWIEHTPKYKIVARFTTDGERTLRRYVEGGQLAKFAEARTATVTLARLRAAADLAGSVASSSGHRFDVGVDLPGNRVEIGVRDKSALLAGLSRRGLSLPAEAVVNERSDLPSPEADVFAGFGLTSCTAGFSVRNQYGETGVTTAGHCSNTQYLNGTLLPYIHGRYSGSYDVQWHTTPGYTDRPWAADDNENDPTPGYRVITSTRGRGSQNAGDYVCKFGKESGHTCGTINRTDYRPDYVPSAAATFVLVKGSYTLSVKGDSGGPWYSGSAALGIHNCGFGNRDDGYWACYMAIDYVSGLNPGVRVLLG